jgi:hypothetical protein
MDASQIKVTREEFIDSYNSHLPNKWTKFAFKYFSQSTLKEDLYVKRIVQSILMGLFGLGFLGAVFNATKTYMTITTISFSVLLLLVAILMFGAFIMNNSRIRKIRKELGLTIEEYNYLALLYIE